MFNEMDFVTPSIKVTSALSSEKAPIRDSKALGKQERKLLEARAEKFRTGLQGKLQMKQIYQEQVPEAKSKVDMGEAMGEGKGPPPLHSKAPC